MVKISPSILNPLKTGEIRYPYIFGIYGHLGVGWSQSKLQFNEGRSKFEFCTCTIASSRHIIEPHRQNTYIRTHAPSHASDQPEHSRSLIRIFTERFLESQGWRVSSCRQWRLWSDCADAQADLSHRCAHMSEGKFSHVEALFLLQLRDFHPIIVAFEGIW